MSVGPKVSRARPAPRRYRGGGHTGTGRAPHNHVRAKCGSTYAIPRAGRPGDPLPFAEMVKIEVEDRCAGCSRRIVQACLDQPEYRRAARHSGENRPACGGRHRVRAASHRNAAIHLRRCARAAGCRAGSARPGPVPYRAGIRTTPIRRDAVTKRPPGRISDSSGTPFGDARMKPHSPKLGT